MANPDNEELFFLLEDYRRSLDRRLSEARSIQLPACDRPVWLQVGEFGARLRWQRSQHPEAVILPPREGPSPEFDAWRFDPVQRYLKSPGTGHWPPDTQSQLNLETEWRAHKFHSWTAQTRGVSLALHAVAFGLLLTPKAMQLDLSKPADWDALRITLVMPELDDLPPLHGESQVPGDGEGGFRGLPRPPIEPGPGPDPIPEPDPEPEQADGAEVPQPVEAEEPEPAEETPALEESEEPEEIETPAAQSPVPGEFRPGTELATSRDPRLLPMPKAPARKRARLQLENPKAAMPSRPGEPSAGHSGTHRPPGPAD